MQQMIDWACNSKVLVSFDKEPFVIVRIINPKMTIMEKLSVTRYPFCCKKILKVKIYDLKNFKQYEFEVKENYCWDGASIPRIFWRLVGANTAAEFLIPSLIHDIMCENHNYIDSDRAISTNVFDALLESSGVKPLKRFLMKNAVAIFQTLFCKW